MSSYNELIKNFERIRAYMRDFYVYGFKSRGEYDRKSGRSYDDERRRVESWLGNYMRFVRTRDGKKVFLSIDSRSVEHNPLFRAWAAKSFTDRDITLHFLLLDILRDPAEALPLSTILARLDSDYLSHFEDAPLLDESTVRGKLREYTDLGLLVSRREGKHMVWHRAPDIPLPDIQDALAYFSEALPCGVIGDFIMRRHEAEPPAAMLPVDGNDEKSLPHSTFSFKHHYITDALDADVLAIFFDAMSEERCVTVLNYRRYREGCTRIRLVPLRVFISVRNGRRYLLAYDLSTRTFRSLRLDYLTDPIPGDVCPDFSALRAELDGMQAHMWGVMCRREGRRRASKAPVRTEHVEFVIRIAPGEEYVVERLWRERRCGRIESLGEGRYRFVADVYDTGELVPWIRTFLCRIERLNFSNRSVENRFKADLSAMYRMYNIGADSAPEPSHHGAPH